MRLVYIALFCTLTSCAAFSPGPTDPATGLPGPSPWQEGIREAGRNYDESPWAAFGPYGAGAAAVLALLAGVRKGTQVYKARKTP